jgi:hydrogenase 3 maturation protease
LKSSDLSALASLIKNRIKGKVAIVGIGNILRGDDALGPKLIELLKKSRINASLFDCGTAPENYIFPILTASCETVILVDAADTGARPGEASVFDLDSIKNISFSTHNPSPRLFTDLLKTGREDINIFVVSVQPKSVRLGDPMTDEVLKGLEILAGAFSEAVA